ncbi:MAG: hypothetical protein JO362_08625 [Streptomycetaceae bacterium]|nr:hypothetical protein [Streptomycetaceae bacterium]
MEDHLLARVARTLQGWMMTKTVATKWRVCETLMPVLRATEMTGSVNVSSSGIRQDSNHPEHPVVQE